MAGKTHRGGQARDGSGRAVQFQISRHARPSLKQLKTLWNSLEGGVVASPFQMPMFLAAFHQHIAPSTCRRPLTLLSATPNGGEAPAALLPLVTVRRGPVKVVTMPDLGLADQNAPVLSKRLVEDPHLAGLACEALLDAVGGGDILDIPKVGPLIGTAANPLFERSETVDVGWTYYFGEEGLAAIDASGGKSVFKEARSKFRKLQRQGVELLEVTDPEARQALLEALLAQRETRFAALDRDNSIETGNRADFYKAISAADAQDCPFKMLALKKGEEVVASVVLMVHGESANGILVSIGDVAWHRLSPGIVLVVQSLKWARENGIRNFSFGTGLQDYKKRFGAQELPTRRLLRPLTVKGRVFATALHAKLRAKSLLEQQEQTPGS